MTAQAHCPNYNHGRKNVAVRYCPNCGDLLNENIAVQECSVEAHEKRREYQNKYCFDCGEQLIGGGDHHRWRPSV